MVFSASNVDNHVVYVCARETETEKTVYVCLYANAAIDQQASSCTTDDHHQHIMPPGTAVHRHTSKQSSLTVRPPALAYTTSYLLQLVRDWLE